MNRLLTFITLFILLSNQAFARKCVVFSLGGKADKPYEKPNESRHITRMNFVAEEAMYHGCKVYKAHNKSLEEITKEMKKFVEDNEFDKSYKFHFSFSDHGSSRKIPLKKGEYVTANEFFESVSTFLPDNAHVTYATHICWGGNLMDAAVAPKKFDLCGSSSVDKMNLSNAFNNPYQRTGEKDEEYKMRKFHTRKKEYLGAGWKAARDKNPFLFFKSKEENPVSILDYHYKAIGTDSKNATRGGALSSTLFAREKLSDIGKDPYLNLYRAVKSNPDFDDEYEYSTATLLSQFKMLDDQPIVCRKDSEIGGKSFEQIAQNMLAILDQNLNWLNANLNTYAFLKDYKEVLLKERALTSDFDIMKSLSEANEIYKSKKKELQAQFDKTKDEKYLTQLAVDVKIDKARLSAINFDRKYRSIFGLNLSDVKNFKPSADRSLEEEIQYALQEKIYDKWDEVEKKAMTAIKPIVKRVRIENDIAMMRKFLQSKKIEQKDKDHFIRMAKCEVKSFI